MFEVAGDWRAERFHLGEELGYNWISCPPVLCGWDLLPGWILPLSWILSIDWDLLVGRDLFFGRGLFFDWNLLRLRFLLCLGPLLCLGLLCPRLAHGDGEELNGGGVGEMYMDSERVDRKDAAT